MALDDDDRRFDGKITFNRDNKFDLQLSQALIDERRLGDVFIGAKLHRHELKSESWQWERTGNIAIEIRCDGQKSGLSVCTADMWVHELKRDGETLLYLMIPVPRLKELCRAAIKAGRLRRNAGDDGRFDVVILSLRELLR